MNDKTINQTTNIVIAALGGEGGGVLANWIEDVASKSGWLAQTTSIAGVAQRTGATIYYIELFSRDACANGVNEKQEPVFSMFPAQGDIDIAIASEVSEAGRLVQRGFSSQERTTLIASSHHIYGINEKEDLADGSIQPEVISRLAKKQCKKFVHFDMREIALQHSTVISASLFGALAGSKALPFDKQIFLNVIEETGKAVENNIGAFTASYNKTIAPVLVVETSSAKPKKENHTDAVPAIFTLPTPTTKQGGVLIERVKNKFPSSTHEFLTLGLDKLIDYQDFDYAHQYLDELESILELDSVQTNYQLTLESARYLALWMCFEDTARVAQIKTRQTRTNKIRQEVQAPELQIIHTTEFFAPQIEEFCQILPPKLAQRIIDSPLCNKLAKPFTKGKRFRTDKASIFVLMSAMAFTRRWRRKSWIYAHEFATINRWLKQVKRYAQTDYQAAQEVIECARMVKGYGATRRRSSEQINRILEQLETNTVSSHDIASWREAAFNDDSSTAFDALIN